MLRRVRNCLAIIIALTITHNDDAGFTNSDDDAGFIRNDAGFTSQTAVAPELRTQNLSAV